MSLINWLATPSNNLSISWFLFFPAEKLGMWTFFFLWAVWPNQSWQLSRSGAKDQVYIAIFMSPRADLRFYNCLILQDKLHKEWSKTCFSCYLKELRHGYFQPKLIQKSFLLALTQAENNALKFRTKTSFQNFAEAKLFLFSLEAIVSSKRE